MPDRIDSSPPYLSLVSPVHNGASFIAESVRTILTALERLGEPFEVIVVADGCADSAAALVRMEQDERVRVLHYPANRGKGCAVVRAGLRPSRIETLVAMPLLWRLHPSLARWLRLGPQAGPSVLIVAGRAPATASHGGAH